MWWPAAGLAGQLVRCRIDVRWPTSETLNSKTNKLTNFRNAVSDSTDLQEKVKAGADLVALGKENGYD
jgi:hypothetical protein